jgi:hypothetical protein
MSFRALFRPFVAICLVSSISAQEAPADLGRVLETTYSAWQSSMVRKDFATWQAVTAPHRQMEVRNRLISEKQAFPDGIFDLPAVPPPLTGLKQINVSEKGATAKAAWFGKVNFGGTPTDNIIVISFVNAAGAWRYDKADFINLTGLPDVRKELAAGDLSYVSQTPDFKATGIVPPTAPQAGSPKYIAKVYVFCPGREVEVQVNRISRHHFINAQEAEVVIGGATDGPNTITYTVKQIEGGTGKEALAVRVYLMPEKEGLKPLKAYEYRVDEGGPLKSFGTATFTVDPATAGKLLAGH